MAHCSESWARKNLGGVVGVRLVRELQGYPCHALAPSEDGTLARQSIACTRTFGKPLRDFGDVLGAVASFASRAAEKLRQQESVVNVMSVFVSKSRYGTDAPPHSFATNITLSVPTSDTMELVRLARLALKRIWAPGTAYVKAGVVFSGLERRGRQTLDLFVPPKPADSTPELMNRLDALNQRFGAGMVKVATALSTERVAPWSGQRQPLSPSYTTTWEGLWRVRI